MENINEKNTKDFNIYYLNFSKVYEIAMMINNVILTKVETNNSNAFEKEYGFTSSITAKGSKIFLDGIKTTLSANAKDITSSSTQVIESLDVKTTKSILLRRVIEKCTHVVSIADSNQGDLVKIDKVKLELFDEESLRQFLILRRDALKGLRVEGMEVNNLVNSMLQDYAYILKGTIFCQNLESEIEEIIIKIPMEVQTEFENKYSIDDLLIGNVSLVGIYKGIVKENVISSNTFTYFQEIGDQQKQLNDNSSKIIKSNESPSLTKSKINTASYEYHFIDTLAIIQDVSFKIDNLPPSRRHWWNRLGAWLAKLGRA